MILPNNSQQEFKIGVSVNKVEEKKKWKEVLKFMKKNPNIMLELLPMTNYERRRRFASSDFFQRELYKQHQ